MRALYHPENVDTSEKISLSLERHLSLTPRESSDSKEVRTRCQLERLSFEVLDSQCPVLNETIPTVLPTKARNWGEVWLWFQRFCGISYQPFSSPASFVEACLKMPCVGCTPKGVMQQHAS